MIRASIRSSFGPSINNNQSLKKFIMYCRDNENYGSFADQSTGVESSGPHSLPNTFWIATRGHKLSSSVKVNFGISTLDSYIRIFWSFVGSGELSQSCHNTSHTEGAGELTPPSLVKQKSRKRARITSAEGFGSNWRLRMLATALVIIPLKFR